MRADPPPRQQESLGNLRSLLADGHGGFQVVVEQAQARRRVKRRKGHPQGAGKGGSARILNRSKHYSHQGR